MEETRHNFLVSYFIYDFLLLLFWPPSLHHVYSRYSSFVVAVAVELFGHQS